VNWSTPEITVAAWICGTPTRKEANRHTISQFLDLVFM
jgi:hypothetical protein